MISIDLKKWLWVVSIPTLLVLLILGYLQAGEPAGFSAVTGTILLTCTLLPGALMRLGFLKENPYLRWLVKYRKDLGIVAGTWLLTHGLVSALFFLKRDQPILDQLTVLPLKPIWMMVPILSLMLLTSNEYSEKLLGKNWNNLHKLVWLLPALMFFHGNLAIAEFEKEDFAPAGILLAVVVLVAFYESFKKKTYQRAALIIIGWLITIFFWMSSQG
jgi:DMSO/TMAO reductase YedYZ heme-binding membrane subunit